MTTAALADASEVTGQIAYLEKAGSDEQRALYRYLGPDGYRDAHRLSAPWKRVELLGYVLPAGAGRVALREYGDARGHFVTLCGGEAAPEGYSPVGDLGFAYERFGRDLVRLMKLRKGRIEVAFDRVAGGCIWHLSDGETQLINNCYYGRQGCVAIELWNATGDHYCPCDCGLTAAVKNWLDNPACRTGAPCPDFAQDGSTVNITTIPIESAPKMNRALGGTAFRPVVYSDFRIDHRATLGILGHDGVLQFRTRCFIPRSSLTGIQRTRINILGLHLGGFMQELAFYDPAEEGSIQGTGWNAGTGNTLVRKSYSSQRSAATMPNFACAVMSDQHGHAVGLMGAAPGQGPNHSGSVQYLLGRNWRDLPSGVGDGPEFANRTVMMTAMNELPLQDGANDYCVYLLVGTPEEVKQDARDLYLHRASLEW